MPLGLKTAPVVRVPGKTPLVRSEDCLWSSRVQFEWNLVHVLMRVPILGLILATPVSPLLPGVRKQLSSLIRWIGNLGNCDDDGGGADVFLSCRP